MKKATLFLALLVSMLSMRSFAQGSAALVPTVTLGSIEASKIENGKAVPTFTTTDRIIRSAKFMAKPNGVITGYSYTIAAGGNTYGPYEVKGAELTEQVISKIKETRTMGVSLFFDKIHVNYNGKEVVANPIALKYDQ